VHTLRQSIPDGGDSMSGGKRVAVRCPKCDVGMKRIYVKVKGRFKGAANGCLKCGGVVWDNGNFIDSWAEVIKNE